MPDRAARQRHWDEAYTGRGVQDVSWFQAVPQMSLELLECLEVRTTASVLDVGAGASCLVDTLLDRGFDDLTVLDVSEVALHAVRDRLPAGAPVTLVRHDLLTWQPARRFDVWHDRAVLHFLVDEEDRRSYRRVLDSALAPEGAVVIATFAPDGPETCSGLPVSRYDADGLAALLGPAFAVVAVRHEEHVTPAGVVQPFTWVAARAVPAAAR
ncbi:MAG TPA: class I SAM-dependent methyltransferase [Acidimicrobiales bacterium]|nr:class I SAM-dependent methyltransferase [Acidimicrobiales bacterium]